ncbi:MAG: SDR family oxidoreductase [Planctomycetes bacterium]|nr:SDR family oxidoreductase [Planctomycetota bacterium]
MSQVGGKLEGPLDGSVAVVTGAGSGIGRAVAKALRGAGARVALLGRRRAALEDTLSLLDAPPGTALALPADVTDRAAVDAAIARVADAWGRIDILVNNAGTNTPRRSLEDIDPEDWDRVVAVVLTGPYNATRAALPHLRRARSGLVINIGSTSSYRASRLAGIAYIAAKHGVLGFSAALALEEKRHGIRATAIHPGEVDTPILEKRPAPVPPERRKLILRPEDVAEAVLFVATRPPGVAIPSLSIEPLAQEI